MSHQSAEFPETSERVALVTGTTRGIGKELAKHLLSRGYRVVGCGRADCDWKADRFEFHTCDISDEKQVASLLRSIRKSYGRLDVLLNNAGVANMNHSLLMPASVAQSIVDTNLVGTFIVSRDAAKLMRRNRYGRIVNFGSAAVPIRLAGEAMYVASKAGVVALGQTMARELAEFGITVNTVGPSPTKTDMIRGVPGEKIDALIDQLPIKRLTTIEDIANVVDFFISEASDAITGQTVYLNGMPNIG